MFQSKSSKVLGYFFILPAILLFTVFFLFPVIQAVVDSFYRWDGVAAKVFNGIGNYRFIFQDEAFLGSIKNNLIIMIASVFVQIPLALMLAVFLSTEFKGYKFFRSAYFIPCIVSTVIIGMLWSFIYNPYFGLVDGALHFLHLDFLIKDWLGDPNVALYSLIAVNIWQWAGYSIVILLAGLKSIPEDIIEAGVIDGTNGIQKLFYISIPMIWDIIEVCVLLAITGSMKAFDLVYIMTAGGPGHSTELMATYMWRISFVSSKYGEGNATAVIILVLSIALTVTFNKLAKRSSSRDGGLV